MTHRTFDGTPLSEEEFHQQRMNKKKLKRFCEDRNGEFHGEMVDDSAAECETENLRIHFDPLNEHPKHENAWNIYSGNVTATETAINIRADSEDVQFRTGGDRVNMLVDTQIELE